MSQVCCEISRDSNNGSLSILEEYVFEKKDYVLPEPKSGLIKILMTDILIQAEVRGQKLPLMLTIFFKD